MNENSEEKFRNPLLDGTLQKCNEAKESLILFCQCVS